MRAQCQCGQLAAELPAKSLITIACHCVDCQRRTGAPFGVLAYYQCDQINVEGEAKSYKRISAEGNVVENYFCLTCGSTVFLNLGKQPGLIGIAIGAIADSAFQPPVWSVWEKSKHHWVEMSGKMQHFEQGDLSADRALNFRGISTGVKGDTRAD
jgi:hypothetical protein